MKIHKGDTVQITGGKDNGKTGKVEAVIAKEGKVVVEGINQYKRHMKAKSQGQQSQILTITKPLPMGRIALLCPKCKKVTRVGYKGVGEAKTRVCRKCGGEL